MSHQYQSRGNTGNSSYYHPRTASAPEGQRGSNHLQYYNKRNTGHQSGNGHPSAKPMTGTANSIFVGNLSYFCTIEDLKTLFGSVGNIQTVKLCKNRLKEPLYYGFIHFDAAHEAREAIQTFNGHFFMGRSLRVRFGTMSPEQNEEKVDAPRSPVSNATSGANMSHSTDVAGIQVLTSFMSFQLDVQINEIMLHEIFSRYGTIVDCVVKSYVQTPGDVDSQTLPKQGGYGFVTFQDMTSAQQALQASLVTLTTTRSDPTNPENTISMDINVDLDCKLSKHCTEKMNDLLSSHSSPSMGNAGSSDSDKLRSRSGSEVPTINARVSPVESTGKPPIARTSPTDAPHTQGNKGRSEGKGTQPPPPKHGEAFNAKEHSAARKLHPGKTTTTSRDEANVPHLVIPKEGTELVFPSGSAACMSPLSMSSCNTTTPATSLQSTVDSSDKDKVNHSNNASFSYGNPPSNMLYLHPTSAPSMSFDLQDPHYPHPHYPHPHPQQHQQHQPHIQLQRMIPPASYVVNAMAPPPSVLSMMHGPPIPPPPPPLPSLPLQFQLPHSTVSSPVNPLTMYTMIPPNVTYIQQPSSTQPPPPHQHHHQHPQHHPHQLSSAFRPSGMISVVGYNQLPTTQGFPPHMPSMPPSLRITHPQQQHPQQQQQQLPFQPLQPSMMHPHYPTSHLPPPPSASSSAASSSSAAVAGVASGSAVYLYSTPSHPMSMAGYVSSGSGSGESSIIHANHPNNHIHNNNDNNPSPNSGYYR